MDLKGFVRETYDSDENRAFRFIEKTDQISQHRGDKIEDGLIKITYQFEKERPVFNYDHYVRPAIYREEHHHHHYDRRVRTPRTPFDYGQPYCGATNNVMSKGVRGMNVSDSTFSANAHTLGVDGNVSVTNASFSHDGAACMDVNLGATVDSFSDAGITVEGQATGQSFQRGHIGTLEREKHSIIFQLKGIDQNEEVAKPVTVQLKKNVRLVGRAGKAGLNTAQMMAHT